MPNVNIMFLCHQNQFQGLSGPIIPKMSYQEPTIALDRVGLTPALCTMKVCRDDDDCAYVSGDVARVVCPGLGKPRESFRYGGSVNRKVAAKALVGAPLGSDRKDKHLAPMALLLGMEHVLKELDDPSFSSMENEFNDMYKRAQEQGFDTEPLVKALTGNTKVKNWSNTAWLPELRAKLRKSASFSDSGNINDVMRALAEDKAEFQLSDIRQLLSNFRLDMDALLSSPICRSLITETQKANVELIGDGESGVFSAMIERKKYLSCEPEIALFHHKNTQPIDIKHGNVEVEMQYSSVKISSYVLRKGTGQASCPISWQLQISVDGREWFVVDKQKNNTELERSGSVVVKLRGMTRPVHMVKLKLTEKSPGAPGYSLAYFDVYGVLKFVDGADTEPEAMIAARLREIVAHNEALARAFRGDSSDSL